ncbi:unnamed protein product [marine sediment metagenome]|uniref:Uncharacterized protein n=1 Tax=marine sediment metagenome TaxID=412755 RepID=X1AHZ2_9ZZZZ
MCWICGINAGTINYMTDRKQCQLICTGCENKDEVSMNDK